MADSFERAFERELEGSHGDRAIVSDEPGTTRDSLDTVLDADRRARAFVMDRLEDG